MKATDLLKRQHCEVAAALERVGQMQVRHRRAWRRQLTRAQRSAAAGALVALCAAAAPPARAADPWAVPPEGRCAAADARARDTDARAPFPFKSGDTVEHARLAALEAYLPDAVWQQREHLFFEGMRIEIGPCFRDYSAPRFFLDASHGSGARLTPEGGLEGWTAGLPFPAASIAAEDPLAGARWAWNAALRYMGAGQRGKFRITQLTRRDTGAVPLEGEFYKLQLAHRADLASSEYRERAADRGLLWVAGGVLTAPFAARDFAWRQFRDEKSLVDPSHSDEIHAYVPQQRRVERLASARVDGLFVPAFSVGGMPDQQLAIPGAGGGAVSAGGSGSGALGGQLGAGASGGGPGGSGGGVSGLPVAQSSAVDRGLESGFGALALRPNLFEWRVVGVRDVLAPINIAAPVYPEAKERSFGPSGLALADRWELRRALVLEARDRRASGAAQGGARTVWYLDLQTLAPLYTVQHDASGAPLSVGIHAGRWSEDRSDYPRWSDDAARPVRVLDSVAELHLPLGGGDGWRRESWDVVAIAPTGEALEQLLSVAPLQRGD